MNYLENKHIDKEVHYKRNTERYYSKSIIQETIYIYKRKNNKGRALWP